MERIAWALIRCQLETELAVELRLCIETLWSLPAPSTPFEVALLPSSVLVGLDGTVELGVPYPADQRYFRRYLAPELTRAETPTVVAAVYAVGALLFEAVSGKPFESSEGVEREVQYLAARAQATGLPPDTVETRLLELAVRATRVQAEERWATPEIFTREIDRAAGPRIATREELAELVRGWVDRRGAREAAPNVAVWRKASEFPAPRGAPDTPLLSTPVRPAPERAANALRRPTDTRAAALITALVLAIPLLGMSLWNWRASAHAAIGTVSPEEPARSQPVASPSVLPAPEFSSERPASPRDSERAATAEAAAPRIDRTKDAANQPVATRRAPKRAPTFKPRGPFDYGI